MVTPPQCPSTQLSLQGPDLTFKILSPQTRAKCSGCSARPWGGETVRVEARVQGPSAPAGRPRRRGSGVPQNVLEAAASSGDAACPGAPAGGLPASPRAVKVALATSVPQQTEMSF